LYLFRSRNTFSNWKKKKSRMGNVQNFPLTTMGVFPDQEWKIPRKSWNSISIFYSVMQQKSSHLQKVLCICSSFLSFEKNIYIVHECNVYIFSFFRLNNKMSSSRYLTS
jgi:hypothetical protein